jgi:hypothetical protein
VPDLGGQPTRNEEEEEVPIQESSADFIPAR